MHGGVERIVLFNIILFLFYFFSTFPEAEQANLCTEEPYMCICHGLYYKRHADRSQSDSSEWHGIVFSFFYHSTVNKINHACACLGEHFS